MAKRRPVDPPAAAAAAARRCRMPWRWCSCRSQTCVPNPWNPNVMDDRTRDKLRAYVQHRGLLQPLVVRPHPDTDGHYQILGGYHRWQICKDELGYETVPCVIVDLGDTDAKVLTINLNELSGEPAPHLLAQLIHDLSRDRTLQDLATQLPYNDRQLADRLGLLKVPDALALQLEAEVQAHRDESPTMVTFVLDEPQAVEEAVTRVAEQLDGKNRRGRALTAICQGYLDAHPAVASTPEASA